MQIALIVIMKSGREYRVIMDHEEAKVKASYIETCMKDESNNPLVNIEIKPTKTTFLRVQYIESVQIN